MTGHEDEVEHHEQDAVERTETVSIAALAEALQALDAVEGDLQRLKRERPDLEELLPYLEFADSLMELRGIPPQDAAEAVRNELISRAAQSQEGQATDPDEDPKR